MEDFISRICYETNPTKQKQIIIHFMNETNFAHPIIQPVLEELKITPSELEAKIFLIEKKPANDSANVSIYHQEARRLAKIEIIAEFMQAKGIFIQDFQKIIKKNYYISKKNNCSYKSILESEPDIPLSVPLNQNIASQRQISQLKKKLERLLKVSDNIKQLKIEEEKRKFEVAKELEEKTEKIKQAQILQEEERNKKIQEKDFKRQVKLRKKYEVKHRQQIDTNETKALEDKKNLEKSKRHDRSKTTLNIRNMNEIQE